MGAVGKAAIFASNAFPEVNHKPGGIWEVVFFAGDLGDYTTPFRQIIAQIAGLYAELETKIEWPLYEPYEDFIERRLMLGDRKVLIYYEHSLNYLAFSSFDRGSIDDIHRRSITLVEVRR